MILPTIWLSEIAGSIILSKFLLSQMLNTAEKKREVVEIWTNPQINTNLFTFTIQVLYYNSYITKRYVVSCAKDMSKITEHPNWKVDLQKIHALKRQHNAYWTL